MIERGAPAELMERTEAVIAREEAKAWAAIERFRPRSPFDRPSAIASSTSRSRGVEVGERIVAATAPDELRDDGRVERRAALGDAAHGRAELVDVRDAVLEQVADALGAVGEQVERMGFLGVIEADGAGVAALARAVGAETIVGVDPISLGVLAPPGEWGADIVVGTTQPLGVHMNCGGGVGGFIATRDEERYAREYPTLQVSICDTIEPGERTFGIILFEQTSYGSRENGKDWTGNSVYLWAIANAVYMALMGPQGFRDVGEAILRRSHYAARRIGELPGVEVKWGEGFFKEFVVNLDATGRTVADVNRALREHGIFGGKDLSLSHPDLGQSALYCVTELHSQPDLDRLVDALGEVTSR